MTFLLDNYSTHGFPYGENVFTRFEDRIVVYSELAAHFLSKLLTLGNLYVPFDLDMILQITHTTRNLNSCNLLFLKLNV